MNNKKIIVIAIVTILVVLLLISFSFAYLKTSLEGEGEYIIKVGSLELELDDANELTLESQIPIEDSSGLKLTGFSFKLTNNSNIASDYTIYLDDVALDDGEIKMADSALRYSLTIDNIEKEPASLLSMGDSSNRIVDKGTIGALETITYTLKIWIDYDATVDEASGKVFKTKLRVEASQTLE